MIPILRAVWLRVNSFNEKFLLNFMG